MFAACARILVVNNNLGFRELGLLFCKMDHIFVNIISTSACST